MAPYVSSLRRQMHSHSAAVVVCGATAFSAVHCCILWAEAVLGGGLDSSRRRRRVRSTRRTAIVANGRIAAVAPIAADPPIASSPAPPDVGGRTAQEIVAASGTPPT